MYPLWRRIVGSLGIAVLILNWMFGADNLTRDFSDVANGSIVLAVIWLITYRAWPALEITWDFFTSPEAKRAYRPTWPHVLGAFGLSLGVQLFLVLFALTLSRNIEVDPWALLRTVLIDAVIAYIAWPAVVMKWRHWRARQPTTR